MELARCPAKMSKLRIQARALTGRSTLKISHTAALTNLSKSRKKFRSTRLTISIAVPRTLAKVKVKPSCSPKPTL
jgi:hypothetical protein